MKEEWKWVNGFEGVYMISSLGRLKSYKKVKDGYILSNVNSNGGYLSVVLAYGCKKRYTRIHNLVAEHFIGEIPKGFHVHHKDGNKQNNIVTNLEIIHPVKHHEKTIKENPQILKGMNNYNRFVRPRPIAQFDKEGNWIGTYCNSEIASIYTGVCQRNILQVANKDTYGKNKLTRKQAGGYVWKFADGL